MIDPSAVLKWLRDAAQSTRVPDLETDPTPWRHAVRGLILFVAFVLALHILWAFGALERAGFSGPALADEQARILEKVDEKLADELAPLRQQVAAMDARTVAILRGLYAERIRTKVRQRCETSDAEQREDLNKQIERIANEFRTLAGEDYGDRPRCSEV